MDLTTLTEAQAGVLAAQLVKHIKAPLDQRDVDLCEKLKLQLTAHFEARELERERKLATAIIPGFGAAEIKDYSFSRLVRGILSNNVERTAPKEYEAHLATKALLDHGRDLTPEMRNMIAGTDSAGGYLVPPQVMEAEITPLLRASMIAFQCGMDRWSGLTGSPVPVPKITGAPTAESVEETEAHTPSDVSLTQLNMHPHDVFAGTVLSNRLLSMSMPSAEKLVRGELVREVGLKGDALAFQGLGSGSEPLGVLLNPDLNEVLTFGDCDDAGAYDKLIDMEYAIIEDNALQLGMPKWVMHPKVFRDLRKMKDPTNNTQPKGRRSIEDEGPKNILGYPFFRSTHLPTDKFLLGVWESVIFGEWGTLIIASSNVAGNNFRNRTTEIIVGMTMDIAVRQPNAICRATGVTYT